MSTKEVFEHVIAGLKKGCLHSYPGVEGYTTDKIHPVTKLPQFYCLQGTSKNEAYHRQQVGAVAYYVVVLSPPPQAYTYVRLILQCFICGSGTGGGMIPLPIYMYSLV